MQNRSLEQIKTELIVKTQSKQFQRVLSTYRKRLSDLNLSIPDGGFKTREAFSLWVKRYSKKHHYIRSSSSFQEKVNEITQGKTSIDQQAYDQLERLYREEGLDEDWFASLAEAMQLIGLDPWNDEHRSFVENLFFFGKKDKSFGIWQVRVRIDKKTKKTQVLARLYPYTTRDWFLKHWGPIEKRQEELLGSAKIGRPAIAHNQHLRFVRERSATSSALWLLITPSTTKRSILRNWPSIKQEIEQFYGKTPRSRRRPKFARDLGILEKRGVFDDPREDKIIKYNPHQAMRAKLFAKKEKIASDVGLKRRVSLKRIGIENQLKPKAVWQAMNRLDSSRRKRNG